MAADNPSIIAPGASQTFTYVGEQVPNAVTVINLDPVGQAGFRLTSGPAGWTLFGSVPAAGNVTLSVEWPSGQAVFTNDSVGNASIEISGAGLKPQTG